MFVFASTLDHKEDIQQYNNNVNLHPVDVSYEQLKVLNHNLIRNSNAYMSQGGNIDPEFGFSWIDNSYLEAQQKFQLGY